MKTNKYLILNIRAFFQLVKEKRVNKKESMYYGWGFSLMISRIILPRVQKPFIGQRSGPDKFN